ncbi:predicted protein [Nematostella vectensis]|uniref:Gamma-butyrobetaine hydroxylase-like N-terminal domain-containing protein n=2 Tax=Nematostella vectensis TaxID=45351 RepID=A7SHP3_NEMVE|nr:gamma-butyrobetaine dioxygenase isoform X2 [Nematostella vectensis]EDO36770.1 predicted protein [Nematostella vectensis]|eukprot:XP_001628833.1 predicted protein [Nematostella vectensis]
MSLQRLFYRGIRSNIKGLSNTLVKCLTSSPDHTRLLQAKEIERNLGDGLLSVTWRDGSSSRYPFIYLRDICRCPQCFHRSSLQRALDPVRELDPSLVASKAELSHDRKQITLTWPNGHVSCFDCDWLFERRLPDSNGQQFEEQSFIREDAQLLGLGADIPTISFDDVLQDERTQLTWLKLIGSHGLVLINGAGSDAGQVKKLGDVLGYLKTMWFGETYPVVNKIGSEDTGASPASIACVPKATCPYKEYRGGLHMIHCRQELGGEGGEHTFVDGFNIAKQLKKEDPENFNRLCTARILYQRKVTNHDADLKMSFSHPVIRLDDKGRLKRIICSEKYRVSFVNVPPNEVPLLYRAYFQFSRLIRNPGYTIKHKLREGDIITMDTDRVLCGRDAYGPEVSGTEVFECGFSDKDMTSSARRLLEKRLSGEGTGFEFDEPVL